MTEAVIWNYTTLMEKNIEIQKILEENVNPVLAGHFGGAELVSYEDNVAKVKMTGACSGCPSAQMTLEAVVKRLIMENTDGVADVVLDISPE